MLNSKVHSVNGTFPARVELPIADGGEGTLEVLVASAGGRFVERSVGGPLGDPVKARFGILSDNKTAVIEMASASCLTLVPPPLRNPRMTTTYGTGELICAALDEGVETIIIGLGGSATNDGGAERDLGFNHEQCMQRCRTPYAVLTVRDHMLDIFTIPLSNWDHFLNKESVFVRSRHAADAPIDGAHCGNPASPCAVDEQAVEITVLPELQRGMFGHAGHPWRAEKGMLCGPVTAHLIEPIQSGEEDRAIRQTKKSLDFAGWLPCVVADNSELEGKRKVCGARCLRQAVVTADPEVAGIIFGERRDIVV